tara:strand:+ start:34825 stop:35673 length:849 start_codon:yes stop_codon:yes gene_type:complete
MNTFEAHKQQLMLLCPEVESICQPLFKLFNITFFRFIRSDASGKKFMICSNPEWLEAYFNEDFYKTELADFRKHPPGSKGISIHSGNCQNQHKVCEFWNKHSKLGNYKAVFTIYQRYDTYFEQCNFASDLSNHSATNIFLNNLDMFKKFILHFKDAGRTLIKTAHKSAFTYPVDPSFKLSDNWYLGLPPGKRELFKQDIKLERVYLDGIYENIYLTTMESMCLKRLLDGKKYKEIGRELNISSRTVEHYIANIKEKLSVTLKLQLLETCKNNNIYEKVKHID